MKNFIKEISGLISVSGYIFILSSYEQITWWDLGVIIICVIAGIYTYHNLMDALRFQENEEDMIINKNCDCDNCSCEKKD